MPTKVLSSAPIGLVSTLVEVEVDIGRSLPAVLIVGLPDAAVQEARERVRAAIKNSGLRFPATRVTVNLAPGNVKKEGPLYDLPVALAIIRAADEVRLPDAEFLQTMFLGELALDGSLRPVRGVLSAAILAKKLGLRALVVPAENAAEAALVDGVEVFGASSLANVIRHLVGESRLGRALSPQLAFSSPPLIDFSSIHGQPLAKRALEISAAGGHNVRLSGPPGAGKTLLARSLAGILPPLTKEEMIEVTSIYSMAGLLAASSPMVRRPFRSPHHTTSHVALVGGGANPRPGEISLAHRGILFLDEFPEFPRHVLEVLRQPLEDGVVHVARAAGSIHFPARFTLVAAENPCPCGYRTDPVRSCACTPSQISAYERRVSGPLLDRIDLHVPVPRLEVQELVQAQSAEPSVVIRNRVMAARRRQSERFEKYGLITNAEMSSNDAQQFVQLTERSKSLLHRAVERLRLSARAYYRVLKVARTIADLQGHDRVHEDDVSESLQFRGGQG